MEEEGEEEEEEACERDSFRELAGCCERDFSFGDLSR